MFGLPDLLNCCCGGVIERALTSNEQVINIDAKLAKDFVVMKLSGPLVTALGMIEWRYSVVEQGGPSTTNHRLG